MTDQGDDGSRDEAAKGGTRSLWRLGRTGFWSRLLLGALLLAFAGSLAAQAAGRRSSEGRYREPVRMGLPDAGGGFVFCRLWYDASRRLPSGLGWSTDYPAADHNFMSRVEELTTTRIDRWTEDEPGYAAVRATDPELFRCPFLFMSDPGSVVFRQDEVDGLREYLLKGGFLWADDLWGPRAWRYFRTEMERILPEYELVEVTPEHPLFSAHYAVERIPQIPSIQSWRRNGGRTAEFGGETERPHMHAIFDEQDRLMVLVSHDTDIADGWERETAEPEFFYRFSPEAYGVGINVLIWTMSH